MENTKIKFGIKNIVETLFKLNYDFNYDNIDMNKIGYQCAYMIEKNESNKYLSLKASSRVIFDKKEILAEDEIVVTFSSDNVDKIAVVGKEGEIVSNASEVLDTFISVSFGALRGILAKNLKGSPIENCILPLIPMSRFRNK